MLSNSARRFIALFIAGVAGVIFSAALVNIRPAMSYSVQAVAVVPYQPQNSVEAEAIQAYLAYANSDVSRPQTTITSALVVENYALLDWVYGEMGGQVVLQKQGDQWQILRGTGGLLGVQFMTSNGVPEPIAQALWSAYEQRQAQQSGGVQ